MRPTPNRRNFLQIASAFGLVPALASSALASAYRYNIFFDYESSELSSVAADLADVVARQILPIARVTLAGHADTAEKNPERLSYARGNEVLKHFLRKQSLVRVRFNVVSSGIAAPLVHTGPNMQEPQNRRVEIILEA